MMVNLAGAPGERVQYLKLKIVLELKEEKQIEAIKPTMPRVTDIFQIYARELLLRPQRLRRRLPPQGRADQARQRGSRPDPGQRGAVQGSRDPVTMVRKGRDHGRQRPTRPGCDCRPMGRVVDSEDPAEAARPLPKTNYPRPWPCNGRPWSRTATAISAPARTPASGCCRRRRSINSAASPSATSRSTTIPAFAPSSIWRWSPTSVCRCSKSSSTAWCGC